jgi:hypothetical protein
MPAPRFLRASHGATVASLADPQNGRCSRHVANLRHRAKHSRHHTKDKQRFLVSVVRMIPSLGTNALTDTLPGVALHQDG